MTYKYNKKLKYQTGGNLHERLRKEITFSCAEKIRIPEYAQNYVLTVNGEAVKYASEEPEYRDVSITAVPYAYWNNRGEGEMSVWIKAWN